MFLGSQSVDPNQKSRGRLRDLLVGGGQNASEAMTLFEPGKPENRRPLHSKIFEREMGLLFFLGTVGVLIGLIYLLAYLGD
jgi:hypothetical protein